MWFHGESGNKVVQKPEVQNRPILRQESDLPQPGLDPGLLAASRPPESPRIAIILPCPEGIKGDKSGDSWPFAGTPRALSTKVTKVVLLRDSCSSRHEDPRNPASPLQSSSSAINGEFYPVLSNLYPFLPDSVFCNPVILLEER